MIARAARRVVEDLDVTEVAVVFVRGELDDLAVADERLSARDAVEGFASTTGQGVAGVVGGRAVRVGSRVRIGAGVPVTQDVPDDRDIRCPPPRVVMRTAAA